jgi:hypothetical protein
MRFEPEKFKPPSSVAAVDTVALVHFIANVVEVVTLLLPEGSIEPKFSKPGGVVTLQVPMTVDCILRLFDPAGQVIGECSDTPMASTARKQAFMPCILP